MEIQPVSPCAQAPSEALQEAPVGGLKLHTDWFTADWGCSPPDRGQHELFAAYVLDVAMQERPHLIRFLTRIGGLIVARPGGFAYQILAEGSWIDVPEIADRLVLSPWVDAHETAH